MVKLGFNRSWVGLVMWCVLTVTYFVIVNGSPSVVIKPERGLRQGDPLSAYLFLFCAEAFTSLLRSAEQNGKIHGIQTARGALVISHLFFADDTILFTRATNEQAGELKRICRTI